MIKELVLIPVSLSQEAVSELFLGDYYRDILVHTKVFFVENVRTARRFIAACKFGVDINELQFEVLDKDTSSSQVEQLFQKYKGHTVGLMSESGCPGIADPGSVAVLYAHRKSIKVIPFIGPSSIMLALMASGFNGQKFSFHGYLPIDEAKKRKELKRLEAESRMNNQTQIFIETPYRNLKFMESICNTLSRETLLCIGSDLSGPKEFIKTAPISLWQKNTPSIQKIPAIFLIYAGKS